MKLKILPISLIVTCYNEASQVATWCDSLLKMDALPNELVIADSNSTDATIEILQERLEKCSIQMVFLTGKCNISEGRNKAIKMAKNEYIAITDFGIKFHSQWLSQIYAGLINNDWVGGCYKMVYFNKIQQSFCKLFDQKVENLNSVSFLPSSRSFGIRKNILLQAGGYNESLIIGEDTEFVLRLKETPLNYKLIRKAIVYWTPRSTINEIYKQNYRYAFWDGLAKQNSKRIFHVIIFLLMFFPSLLVYFISPNYTPLFFLVSLFLLFIKVNISTLQHSSNSLGNPLDTLVYFSVVSGSAIGYAMGRLKRYISKKI